jgi:arginine decarboxylase
MIAKGFFLPKRYFLTCGYGRGNSELVAFDSALITAGVADLNLIKLSSIVAPGCVRINPVKIQPGSFVGVAFAKNIGTHTGEMISSAIAVGHPKDKSRASLVMEYSSSMDEEHTEKMVREMVKQGLDNRMLDIDNIESTAVSCVINEITYAATFAAVVEL